MRTKDLFQFIQRRHEIYLRREAGKPKPWTLDPILQSYRFCNVYRELDTVTQWIRQNWREPNAMDPDMWFAMTVARLVNWPETLAEVGYPVPWRPTHFMKVLNGRMERGEKVFTGAYMVRCDIQSETVKSKADYLGLSVLTPLWEARKKVRPKAGDTLDAFCNRLLPFHGIGSFMAGQIVADTKYEGLLVDAPDWLSWATMGPGSARGLNRVLERDKNAPWKEGEWARALQDLRDQINPLIKKAGMPQMHAQDLQNCLCEADKYWRVENGEGRPRSLYNGRG